MRYLHYTLMLAVLLGVSPGCGSAAMAYYEQGDANMAQRATAAAPMADPAPGFASEYDGLDEDAQVMLGGEIAQEAVTPEKPRAVGADAPKKKDEAQRLIIYRADLGVFVFKIDEALASATALAKEQDGWVQQSTTQSLLLRVPVERFDALVTALSELGDVHTKNIVGTDVSEEFFDLQIRLRNAEALRDRYLKLLAEAKNVTDSLAIEKELARITEEIERFKGRIRFLKDQGTYSTIAVRFEQKPDQPIRKRTNLPFSWLREYSLDALH